MLNDTKAGRLLRWKAGEKPGPWLLTVFPTNICNLHCKHCWLQGPDGVDADKVPEVPDERLLELVDEGREMDVRDWIFIGGGEPLLRGDVIMQMIEKIVDYGANGTLQANGTLLRSKYAKQLVDLQWDRINVSLDGPTEKINDDIRSAGFKAAVKNIRYLSGLKKERGLMKPEIGLYTVIHSQNYDKLEDMVELAHDLGCDGGIQFTTMVLHSDHGKPYVLSEEQAAQVPDHVQKAKQRAEEYGMFNNFDFYLRHDMIENPNEMNRVDTSVHPNGMGHSLCYEPFLAAAITAQGNMGPCCAFWDEQSQSIRDMSFEEAWNGPYMTELREQHLVTHELPGYCARCPSNLFCKNEIVRADVHALELAEEWQQLSVIGRVTHVASKGLSSLRSHGPISALKRGVEWALINKHSGDELKRVNQ